MRCGLFGSDLHDLRRWKSLQAGTANCYSADCAADANMKSSQHFQHLSSISAFFPPRSCQSCRSLQVSWLKVNLLPGPPEGTFPLDLTPLPGKDGFFMQSDRERPLSEHLSTKSGLSMACDAVGPLDFLDFSQLPSPSACTDWLKLRRSEFARAGRAVPVWSKCTWTNADGWQTRLNASQGKRCRKPWAAYLINSLLPSLSGNESHQTSHLQMDNTDIGFLNVFIT